MTSEGTPNFEVSERRRMSRYKTDLIWQKILQSDSRREEVHRRLSARFPMLSKTDLKICVLLREDLISWQIGKLLETEEHTVNNHRSRIHKKLGVPTLYDLSSYLKGF